MVQVHGLIFSPRSALADPLPFRISHKCSHHAGFCISIGSPMPKQHPPSIAGAIAVAAASDVAVVQIHVVIDNFSLHESC